ncbi:MAG: LptE family protein [Desulfococcaceae bacterium]|nr:LptE family protein [Desulfococcaceae bacterium]
MKSQITLLFAVLLLLSACGYRFAGGGKLPFDVQSLHVEIYQNRTSETGAEVTFSNDMAYEFSRNGYQIADKEKAGAVVSGEIISILVDTVSRRGQIGSLERRVSARVNIRITDSEGKELRNLKNISQSDVFAVSSESSTNDYNKKMVLESISKRIAEDVYSRLTEEF